MSAPTGKPDPFDPFGIAASMNAWCCLLTAARELRDMDEEMMDTLLETHASAPAPMSPDAVAKVRSLAALMRSLRLDPDAIRQREPEAMRTLETVCLNCTERSRCTRELWAGTAACTYSEFCPNASRLGALRAA
ncbi:DUF6455 family protein [Methylobacterium sp. P31]